MISRLLALCGLLLFGANAMAQQPLLLVHSNIYVRSTDEVSLLNQAEQKRLASQRASKTTTSIVLTRIDAAALATSPPTLSILLPNGKTLTFVRNAVTEHGWGGQTADGAWVSLISPLTAPDFVKPSERPKRLHRSS